MEKHWQLSHEEFEKQFADCSLEPEWFTHEAHLRLAWIHISKYGLEKAIESVCFQIQNFAVLLGAKDKFNKTVTIGALKAVYHFMNRSASNDFESLIKEFPRLKTEFKGLMNKHYGIDIFKSATARNEFIEPDLLPFD
jgi:N-formylglutamate deformylase